MTQKEIHNHLKIVDKHVKEAMYVLIKINAILINGDKKKYIKELIQALSAVKYDIDQILE